MLETLIKLGLSEKEAAVYLATLELGEDTALNIAEKSQVNRTTTYVILEKLMKLGLASTVERGKKTVFVAEDPRPPRAGNLMPRRVLKNENCEPGPARFGFFQW
jgi:sugar-specific transcriptional regulator TrmB